MIEIGKGGQRQAADVRLSRYACYLVVQKLRECVHFAIASICFEKPEDKLPY